MRRLMMSWTMTALLAAVAGCGGGGAETPATPEQATATTPPGLEATNQTSASEGTPAPTTLTVNDVEGASDSNGSPVVVSTASITIDGETLLFQQDEGGSCDQDLLGLGLFRAILTRVDETGQPVEVRDGDLVMQEGVTMSLLHPGAGGPDDEHLISIRARVTWTANSQTRPGSQVDTVSIDGNYAEGTATFISNEGAGPVTATFEVTCADS